MYTHSPNQNTHLAVWHITEPESFFSGIQAGKNISHPHKRLQHLCGRYLLQHLAPTFPITSVIAEQNNKPFIPGHPYHFSISHCDDYAAAIVSTTQKVGIDVETVEQRVLKIRHKFLTNEEENMLVADLPDFTDAQRLTLAWSVKETMFKWLGETGVDFKAHLLLKAVNGSDREGVFHTIIQRNEIYMLQVAYYLLKDVVLTWAII
jgi:4'-phosphopantetheinyl transferase EntD